MVKPLPAVSDVAFALALLMMHQHALARMRLVFPVLVTLSAVSVLLPVMHYLWVHAGSGNANFVYNQTLVWSCLWGFLFLEFASTHVRVFSSEQKARKAKEAEAAAVWRAGSPGSLLSAAVATKRALPKTAPINGVVSALERAMEASVVASLAPHSTRA